MKVTGLVILGLVFGGGCSSDKNENLYNRRIKKFTGSEKKTDGLIQDKCGLQLVEETVRKFGSTFIFITDDHHHVQLMENLERKFLHSYFTEPSQLSDSMSDIYGDLLIFDRKFQLKEVIKKKKPPQATKFFMYVRNYEEAIMKFEILWENRLVNAVATYVENSTVYYYTYFPYAPTHCGTVGIPHLSARCDISNGVFSHREKLFPEKTSNLHKCPINVTFSEQEPAAYYGEEKKPIGWEVDLMNEILERMNGVPSYEIVEYKKRDYKIENGYSRLVERSEIGAGLVVSLRGLMKTDFSLYGMSLCCTWFEPKREPPPLSIDFLTKVYPPDVWVLIMVVYITITTLIWAFYKTMYWNTLYKLLPLLFGTTTKTKGISNNLGILWLLFCLFMNAFYQSRFQSTFLVPNQPQQLSSTEEILESNVKIIGAANVMSDMIPFFKQRYNFTSKRLINRKLSHDDWVYRMIIKKDSVYLGFKEVVEYHLQSYQLTNQIYISDTCVIKYLLGFVLKRNSHLTEIITKFSKRLNENGFLAYFIRKHLPKQPPHTFSKKYIKIVKPASNTKIGEVTLPLNLTKVFVIFKCLGGGLLLAFVAFVVELMSAWDWNLIRRKILREFYSAFPCEN